MGSLFSEEVENREVMSPGASNPGALNMVEEIHLGEETKGDTEESKMMEESTSGNAENRGEMTGQSNNEGKDKVRWPHPIPPLFPNRSLPHNTLSLSSKSPFPNLPLFS